MKKTFIAILLIVLSVALCVGAVACNRSGSTDDGVVVSFVTGFENSDSPLIIEPVVTTHAKPGVMPKDPLRAGYRFLGWFYDREYQRPFSTKDDITEDITLYAKWEKRRANSGSDEPSGEVDAPNGVRYRLNEDETYTVVGYNGKAEELVLAVSYGGKKITTIAFGAFDGNATLKSITVSDSVAVIEDGAFFNCKSLEKINVSADNETYTSAGGAVYASGGTKLVAVGQARTAKFEVSSPVADVSGYAFAGGEYEVELKSGEIKALSEYSFAYYAGKVTIGKNVKEIRRRAFYESTAEVNFAENATIDKLAMGEFDGYKGKKLIIPSTVRSISASPFFGSTAEIDFAATGIIELGESAFAGYEGKTLVIPYFVKKIDRNAFYRCTSEITFDERTSYAYVDEYVFNDFRGKATLPSTVKSVRKYAFYSMRYGKVEFALPKADVTIADDAFLLCKTENVTYGK